MNRNIQSVRGMSDYLPKDTIIWRYIESTFATILSNYGYNEIRFPIIEHLDLFKRSIGEITDVIEKEMYSFDDRSGNKLTLRPEGTSGCVRAGIEHGLFYHQEQRFWYLGPMFRYERPQKGRYRQFHQFGAEVFGQIGPDIDVELILITARCWQALGISQYLTLELNSIGSMLSRMNYCKKLINFFEKHLNSLDHHALHRLYSNPMRILDTKNIKIRKLLCNAPILSDYLDEDSRFHFFELCKLLDISGVKYKINPYLVRGLDYYNRTVFEWVTEKLGVKKTICAGGRYDGLVKQLGGISVPAVGFSIGLERIILLMQAVNSVVLSKSVCTDVYLITLGYNARKSAVVLSEKIRSYFPILRIIVSHSDDNLKKQFSYAYKNNTRIVLIMNKQNTFEKMILLKDLRLGDYINVSYDAIVEKLKELLYL